LRTKRYKNRKLRVTSVLLLGKLDGCQ